MKTPNFRRHRIAAAVAGAVLALGADAGAPPPDSS